MHSSKNQAWVKILMPRIDGLQGLSNFCITREFLSVKTTYMLNSSIKWSG